MKSKQAWTLLASLTIMSMIVVVTTLGQTQKPIPPPPQAVPDQIHPIGPEPMPIPPVEPAIAVPIGPEPEPKPAPTPPPPITPVKPVVPIQPAPSPVPTPPVAPIQPVVPTH